MGGRLRLESVATLVWNTHAIGLGKLVPTFRTDILDAPEQTFLTKRVYFVVLRRLTDHPAPKGKFMSFALLILISATVLPKNRLDRITKGHT